MSDVEHDEGDYYDDDGVVDELDVIEDPDVMIEVQDNEDDDDDDEEGAAKEDDEEGEEQEDSFDDELGSEEGAGGELAVLEDQGDASLNRDYIYNKSAKPHMIKLRFMNGPEAPITSETISINEYTRVVAVRAKQISSGSPKFTDCSGLIDAESMAIKEIRDRRCPLMVTRGVGIKDGKKVYDVFKVNEMIIPF